MERMARRSHLRFLSVSGSQSKSALSGFLLVSSRHRDVVACNVPRAPPFVIGASLARSELHQGGLPHEHLRSWVGAPLVRRNSDSRSEETRDRLSVAGRDPDSP